VILSGLLTLVFAFVFLANWVKKRRLRHVILVGSRYRRKRYLGSAYCLGTFLLFLGKRPFTHLFRNNYGVETDGLGFRLGSIILVLVLVPPLSYTLFCGMSLLGDVLGY